MTTNETRDANRASVQLFFRTHGEARLALFADDGVKEIPFWSINGESRVLRGLEALRENFVRNTTVYADWLWEDVEIFDTQDPDQFFVECRGGGNWTPVQGGPASRYSNHYVMHFRFEHGKIRHFREFFNPLLTAVATGGVLQKIKVIPL